ncbi:hypothetical protein HT746_00415 [Burkholderia pyrrocinia]|uniref:Tc toxin subunit A n=1 Tax=Burkholderia pyrrocinia TaxID=60550 RepID=UPI00157663AD|nr:Tc toxin subunit A [Burkholderia pyrrocinia]NTX25628.1 hypothetical protein [Burkholderia pyrrocinia]
MTLTSPLIKRTEQLSGLPDALAELGYHSVFDVVRVPRERFIRQHSSTLGRRAEKMYDLAIGYAHQVSHAFRHNRVTRAVNAVLSGPFSKSGPDYASQFLDAKTGWKDKAPSGAPEANDGSVAYLAHIYHRALHEESDGASALMHKLSERRPDIGSLVVDDSALNQEIPQIQLVNEVLGSAIQGAQKLKDLNDVNTLLSITRYPNTLPFHYGNQQMRVAESTLDVSLSDRLLAQVDMMPGRFWSAQAQLSDAEASDLTRLQIMASRLAPEQQKIVTEPAYFGQHHLWLSDIYDKSDDTKEWKSPNITMSLPDANIDRFGFILPLQESITEYEGRPALLSADGGDGDYSIVQIQLINSANRDEKATVVLRGRYATAGRYYFPLNAAPYMAGSPHGLYLLLSLHTKDNPNLDLSKTWIGKFEVLFVSADLKANHGLEISLCLSEDDKAKYSPAQSQFYLNNYGNRSLNVDRFGVMEELTSRTGLTVPDVEGMFCATAGGSTSFTVVQSDNYIVPNRVFGNGNSDYPTSIGAALPFLYGAKFIHAGIGNCINLSKDSDGSLKVNTLADDRLDRINRMIRLQKWTCLSFEDLDLLVTSAMEAEGDANRALLMNDNTLRMLGVFKHYQATYGATPKQFAAWLHIVTPFGITPDKPFLDQVFNSSGAFDTPFVVDNQDFVYTLTTGDDGARVKKICAALGLNHRQFKMLADQIARHQGDASLCTLNCNIFVVSAFYRLASLAKTFGSSPDDFCVFVDLMDNDTGNVWRQLAGNPVLTVPQKDAALYDDFLTLLQALNAVSQWLQGRQLSARAAQLMTTVKAPQLPAAGSYATASIEGQMDLIAISWKDLIYNKLSGDLTLTQQISLRGGEDAYANGIWELNYTQFPADFSLNGSMSWEGEVSDAVNFNTEDLNHDDLETLTLTAGWYPKRDVTYVLNIPLKAKISDLSKLTIPSSIVRVHPYGSDNVLNFSQGRVLIKELPSGNYETISDGYFSRVSLGWKDFSYNIATGDFSITQQVAFCAIEDRSVTEIEYQDFPSEFKITPGALRWSCERPDGTDLNHSFSASSTKICRSGTDPIQLKAGKTYIIDIPINGKLSDFHQLDACQSKLMLYCGHETPDATLHISQKAVLGSFGDFVVQGTNTQLDLVQTVWQQLANTLVDSALLPRSGAPLVDDHGKAIDWWPSLSGDNKLIDTFGLVTDAADHTVSVTIGGQAVSIIQLVSDTVDAQALGDTEKAQAKSSLNTAVVQARQTQTGVATSLLAKTLEMSQSLSALVLRWAQLTPYQWLKRTWALKSTVAAPADIPAPYLSNLQEIARRALLCQQFSLSAAVVQRLLAAPSQFSLPASYVGDVTPSVLYMLSRYDDLLHQVGVAGQGTEDDVLAYLQAVNRDTPLSGPEAAEQLASLLGWEPAEVSSCWQVLGQTAKTVADLDVVLRLQQAERDTGLTVSQQQQAFVLNRDRSYDAWQAVGQAMVAGANHVKSDH